jgi:hypothetical protein
MSGLDEQGMLSENCPMCGEIPDEYRIFGKGGTLWWLPEKAMQRRGLTKPIILDNGGQSENSFIKNFFPISKITCLVCFKNIEGINKKFFDDILRVVKRNLLKNGYYIWSEWCELSRKQDVYENE